MSDPSKRLCEALAELRRSVLDARVERAVEDFVARAVSGHPELGISAHSLAAVLWGTLEAVEVERWQLLLDRLVAPDLLLAAALRDGHPVALARFEQRLVPAMKSTLAGLGLAESERDELLQRARIHILVASSRGRPRIASYGGKGSLDGWVRTTTLRFALRQLASRRSSVEPTVLDRLGLDPQVEPLPRRRERRAQLRIVVGDAFAELPPEQRRLLRVRYLEQQTAVQIAAALRVHPSTISRRLEQAREALRTRALRRVEALVGPGDALGSRLVETLSGDLESSLRGLFDTRERDDV